MPIKPPQPWLDRYWFDHFDADPLKDASFKRYAAYASHMDAAIGQLVELLEATGQRDDTIIVFSTPTTARSTGHPSTVPTATPGWQEASPRLGSNLPFRGVKAQLYEGGIRTPTVINWRGHLAPGIMAHPVHVVDWMPTFCNLLGATPQRDPQWDGTDIWPLLAGTAETPADPHALLELPRRHAAGCVRAGDWKLIAHEDDERQVELFNIADDPYEAQELAAEHPRYRAGAVGALIREQRSLDDTSRRDDVTSAPDRLAEDISVTGFHTKRLPTAPGRCRPGRLRRAYPAGTT